MESIEVGRRRRLSAWATFYLKILLPILFGVGMSLCSAATFIEGRNSAWILAAATLGGLLMLRSRTMSLKSIYALDDGILVGNFIHSDRVAYADIAQVERMWSSGTIKIRLVKPCRFGSTVEFLPTHLTLSFFGINPAMGFLRDRLAEKRRPERQV